MAESPPPNRATPQTPAAAPAARAARSATPASPRRWRGLARRAALVLAAALTLLVLVLTVLLALLFQRQALVPERADIAYADVERAMGMLRRADPRKAPPGVPQMVVATERDLDLLLNHASRRWLGARARVSVDPGRAQVQLSAEWPGNPFGRWLNLQADLVQTGALPALDRLSLGRLPVPPAWAEALLPHALRLLHTEADLALATDIVRRVSFAPERAVVLYAWREDSSQRMMDALVPRAEQERLRAYHDRLVQVAARQAPAWQVSMVDLLVPLMALAQERSLYGGDAAAESRAALSVLALYVNGRQVGGVLPLASQWPRARPLRVLLGGRTDFPRHFLVSAVLAIESTSPLAQAIGLYKEVKDSRGGSGFSFNDMAANLAGTRFGERSQRDPHRLHDLVLAGITEADLMPPVDDLPEHIPEPEFLRVFGGVGGAGYERQMAEIEARVAVLPVLR
jgi:hypothetical protein